MRTMRKYLATGKKLELLRLKIALLLLFLGSAGVSRGVKGRWSPADLDFSRVMPYYKFRLPSARKLVQTVGTLATRLNPLRIWGTEEERFR